MKVKLNIFIFFNTLVLLTSCDGQTSNKQVKTENIVKGNTVSELGNSVMVIFQDSKNDYWFGSWETGVYKFDGKELVNYTTKHGLLNNRIDEIKEDKFGNIYFSSANATSKISKFNGKTFATLKAVPSENWKLEPTDMWFKYSYGNTGKVYRYDGITLFELQFPNPPNLLVPFDIYSIYKDRKGNIWFGTNPVGVCRYDGKSFEWITEEDVTEFRNEGANGVRSITEDKNGDFWFNTENRYSVYDSTTLKSNTFYTRHKSIGGLDGKKDSNLDEYLSTVKGNNNNLWFVTYLDGVWKYDGAKITHYAVKENSKQISLFSIYKDNKGDLWLGTHKNGAYKFNGTAFEKFIK
ncbi:two component regulator with propeller domain [Winogradskyella wandonensis]|uniref:Two component regulator with propeller domain n=1 Tax=Winogradskyella wandonensis TaxID=1442586 RepID=A0A4R1KPB5_9FLAO|nr:two-component regulator propeller domain-containing protein [Winogradskyella wandonensis]TCK66885.1 two component regulator with propeller domain [Winogradskyella wandonensis]